MNTIFKEAFGFQYTGFLLGLKQSWPVLDHGVFGWGARTLGGFQVCSEGDSLQKLHLHAM